MRDMSWREMMALKATEDPMLMSARRHVMAHDTKTALRGVVEFLVWDTEERNFPKGRPPSRAKAKV